MQWAERANRYVLPDTIERAWLDGMLAYMQASGYRLSAETTVLASRAADLARRLGDPDAYWHTAVCWLSVTGAPRHDEERLRVADELANQPRQGVNVLLLTYVLWVIAHTFLEFGQRGRAEDIIDEMRALAERSGQPNLLIISTINDAVMAIWDGRLEEAVAIRRQVMARAEELGIAEFALLWTIWTLPATGCTLEMPAGPLRPTCRAREVSLRMWVVTWLSCIAWRTWADMTS